MNLDIDALEESWTEKLKLLKTGLLAGDIWDRSTGLGLSGHNSNPAATALFNQLTTELDETLSGSGFPGLNKYYLLNLEDEKMAVIIRHQDDLLEGWLLDPKQINMGILFSVAIPKAIAIVNVARS